jgi:polyphosphate kinase
MTVAQQLAAIFAGADKLMDAQQRVWNALRGHLAEAGIDVLTLEEVGGDDAVWLERYFREQGVRGADAAGARPGHPFRSSRTRASA